MELISRQQAIDAFNTDVDSLIVYGTENAVTVKRYLNGVLEKIKQLPPIQPKRGNWVYKGKNGDWQWRADGRGSCWDEWQCDQCKGVETKMSNFCPNCGADMREVTT